MKNHHNGQQETEILVFTSSPVPKILTKNKNEIPIFMNEVDCVF